MILPLIIEYKSKKYDEMVALRHKILREPLGLSFTEEDLQKDKEDFLLAIYISGVSQIAACCILTPIDGKIVKLRQMAVDDILQKAGVGTAMLSFAEYVATKEGFNTIILHARKTAVGFYEKYGYQKVGDEFTEVGIAHCRMEKIIKYL